jgi:hypothetical protein
MSGIMRRAGDLDNMSHEDPMDRVVTRTWREQYDRMRRWQERVQTRRPIDQPLVDDCYAFLACCVHLRDWVRHDAAVPPEVRQGAGTLFDAVDGDEWLRLCADLVNGTKRMELSSTRRLKEEDRAEATDGPGAGRAGTGSVLLVRVGGKAYRIHHVVNRSVEVWDAFLTRHGLLVP